MDGHRARTERFIVLKPIASRKDSTSGSVGDDVHQVIVSVFGAGRSVLSHHR